MEDSDEAVRFTNRAEREPILAEAGYNLVHIHSDDVVECVGEVFEKRGTLKGMRIVYEPPVLRHFTARFEPLL